MFPNYLTSDLSNVIAYITYISGHDDQTSSYDEKSGGQAIFRWKGGRFEGRSVILPVQPRIEQTDVDETLDARDTVH